MNKNVKIKSCCLKADELNNNNRIYPLKEVEKVYNNLKNNAIPITLDFPSSVGFIPPEIICGKVSKVYMENNNLWIEGEICSENFSVASNIVNDMLSNNISLYCCSFGVGNINEKNEVYDYDIKGVALYPECAFDIKPLEIINEEENEPNIN